MDTSAVGNLVTVESKYCFVPEEFVAEFENFASYVALWFCYRSYKPSKNGRKLDIVSSDEFYDELKLYAFSIAYLYPEEVQGYVSVQDHMDVVGYAAKVFEETRRRDPEFLEENGIDFSKPLAAVKFDQIVDAEFESEAEEYYVDSMGGEEPYELNFFGFVNDCLDYLQRNRIVHNISTDGYEESYISTLFPQTEVW